MYLQKAQSTYYNQNGVNGFPFANKKVLFTKHLANFVIAPKQNLRETWYKH